MTASEDMKNQSVDDGGYTPAQIRGLKIAIAVMTTAILVALGVMAFTILGRNRPAKPAASPSLASGKAVDLSALYPGSGPVAQAQLPPGGHVTALTVSGETLILTVEDTSGTSLLVFDPKTGRITPLARLTPKP
jgi:hypothetical protein